jgi:hypothetical protein
MEHYVIGHYSPNKIADRFLFSSRARPLAAKPKAGTIFGSGLGRNCRPLDRLNDRGIVVFWLIDPMIATSASARPGNGRI